ncbi:unnamed protein product [Trifolium pratense]|uniref:Uncharacterized protein n=1 Tax=Trifolium pratense TaxID=57577 RepID=A0ACB0K2D0_TRIPR|nr:unnamed protein product [Trifolium pratense]
MYQIAIGIARGLEYLHRGCVSRILHLDIKPQNILLDENFCPKIFDFGLAKIYQRNDSVVSILGTRGTIGYIAPEVFSRTYGGVSHKSGVYSYDMSILEMIGGRKNYDIGGSCTSKMSFLDWIYKDLEQGNNLENCLANSEEENDMVRQITMLIRDQVVKMMKMKVVCAMLLMVVLMVEVATIAEAVNCNPLELSPCLGAITSDSPPSAECCNKLKEQIPCLCEYIKNPMLSPYVNSPGSKRVASACGVDTPQC